MRHDDVSKWTASDIREWIWWLAQVKNIHTGEPIPPSKTIKDMLANKKADRMSKADLNIVVAAKFMIENDPTLDEPRGLLMEPIDRDSVWEPKNVGNRSMK